MRTSPFAAENVATTRGVALFTTVHCETSGAAPT